jgi:hypothetical protein
MAGLLAAVVFALALANWLWHAQIARLTNDIKGQASTPAAPRAPANTDDLPVPVRRFLNRSVPANAPTVRLVHLITAGEFRMGAAENSWRPFRAEQDFSVDRPGFVWDARIRMAPFLPVYVRDVYAGGRGETLARVLGAHTVAHEGGEATVPDLAAGQLIRLLGETIWFPTALRPGPSLAWTAIDDARARATLTDGGTEVSLEFTFNADGDITEVFSPDRPRSVDGAYVPTPWVVRCFDHQVRNGLRIPVGCEAEWRLPAGPLSYWRGRVVKVTYQ